MKRKIACLLLACLLLSGVFAACDTENQAEMTAVTINTEESSAEADAEQTSESAGETEEKTRDPIQPNTPSAQTPTEPPTEPYRQTDLTLPSASEVVPSETEAVTQPEDDLRSVALLCVGSDISVLYALIGAPPNGSVYQEAYDVNGNLIGENGVLYYDGFSVFTFRDKNAERIMSVS